MEKKKKTHSLSDAMRVSGLTSPGPDPLLWLLLLIRHRTAAATGGATRLSLRDRRARATEILSQQFQFIMHTTKPYMNKIEENV